MQIAELGVDSLLARLLTALALAYEATGKISLAPCANVLGAEPTPLRGLPRRDRDPVRADRQRRRHLERAGLAKLVPIPAAKTR